MAKGQQEDGKRVGGGIGHKRRTERQAPRAERDAQRRARQLARQAEDDRLAGR